MTTHAHKTARWIAEGNIMYGADRLAIEARARAIRAAVLGGLLASGWSALRNASRAAIHRLDPRLPGAA